jgi:hypothetical protein
MKSLKVLSIKGLDQATLHVSSLADLVLSLPNLEILDGLCNLNEEFWNLLYKGLQQSPRRALPLRCLTLTWDENEGSLEGFTLPLFQTTLMAIIKCLPNLRYVHFQNLKTGESSTSSIAPTAIEMSSESQTQQPPSVESSSQQQQQQSSLTSATKSLPLNPRTIVATLQLILKAQTMGQLPVTKLQRLTVSGLGIGKMTLEDLAVVGKFNLLGWVSLKVQA